MHTATRPRHPARSSEVLTRLRLWSQLWHRYAGGAHLDVSGADALRARDERRSGAGAR